MDAIEWLEANATGFSALSPQERTAPMHFSLLWSYFEAKALATNGSVQAIEDWLRNLATQGKLDASFFTSKIDYFKSRYYSNNDFTPSFRSLGWRSNRNSGRALAEGVISSQNTDPIDGVVALFIIIYRIRNNYFHGPKWSDHLKDQLNNFTTANDSIMAVIDMSRN